MWIPPVTVSDKLEKRVNVLLWQVRGHADLCVAGGSWHLGTGQAMWVPVGYRHSFTVGQNSVTMPLFFSSDVATTMTQPRLIPVSADLRTLMLAYSVSSTTAIKPAANLARQILTLLERAGLDHDMLPVPVSPAARSIAEALRRNPADTRTVEQLAASVFSSSRTIGRAFLTETKMTLQQWRIHNRMQVAANLLTDGVSLTAVARRVGYTNVNALRRAFTAHFGVTPYEYTRGNRISA